MSILKSARPQQGAFEPIKKEGRPSLPMALSVARKNRAKGVPKPAHLDAQEHAVAALGEHPKSLVEAIREKRRMAKGGEVEPLDDLDDDEDQEEPVAPQEPDEDEPKSLVERIRAKRKVAG